MKKAMPLVLSLTLVSTILFGCQSEDTPTVDSDKTKAEQQGEVVVEISEELKLEAEIAKVSISQLTGDFATVFDDATSINAISDIMSNAVKQDGVVSMESPEFELEVDYVNGDKQTLYLWIGEKGELSTFMNANDTHTIHTVSKDMTDKLIDLIK